MTVGCEGAEGLAGRLSTSVAVLAGVTDRSGRVVETEAVLAEPTSRSGGLADWMAESGVVLTACEISGAVLATCEAGAFLGACGLSGAVLATCETLVSASLESDLLLELSLFLLLLEESLEDFLD